MSQSAAQREAIQAVTSSNALTPMGRCNAQEMGGSLYSLLPAPLPASLGIDQGTELVVGYHAQTNTIVVSPAGAVDPDHWASQFVDLETL